ncbi:GL10786 [Drosophila persimilis]|uniref:Odorant receptor n=1 Tax=Drosophila persimilis TaxID=7234 RepID=B4GA02_DROPE|nr:GL10786 [Drosophila persimilis]
MVEPSGERVGLRLSKKWKRFMKPYAPFRRVYRTPGKCPEHTVPYLNREQLISTGYYPNSTQNIVPGQRSFHVFLLVKGTIFYSSILYAAFESLDDIVELGRDLAFIIASFFIYFKLIYFLLYADNVDEVINGLEECYRWERAGPAAAGVRSAKRLHYLIVIGMQIIWVVSMIIFIVLLISTPFWTQQELPLHAAYPFHLHDSLRHPRMHILIYLSQSFDILYYLTWLTVTECMSVSIYSQLTTALSVLLVDRCNEVFHGPLIMQMIVNFLLVSLSVFEAMMARHDPKVAGQFILLMILALGHLSMWTKFGDMMSQESLEVAEAAYEAYDSSVGSKKIYWNIRFIIMRAQEPLIMRATPFPTFNMTNYKAILNQCYGILTLLMNTLD